MINAKDTTLKKTCSVNLKSVLFGTLVILNAIQVPQQGNTYIILLGHKKADLAAEANKGGSLKIHLERLRGIRP